MLVAIVVVVDAVDMVVVRTEDAVGDKGNSCCGRTRRPTVVASAMPRDSIHDSDVIVVELVELLLLSK